MLKFIENVAPVTFVPSLIFWISLIAVVRNNDHVDLLKNIQIELNVFVFNFGEFPYREWLFIGAMIALIAFLVHTVELHIWARKDSFNGVKDGNAEKSNIIPSKYRNAWYSLVHLVSSIFLMAVVLSIATEYAYLHDPSEWTARIVFRSPLLLIFACLISLGSLSLILRRIRLKNALSVFAALAFRFLNVIVAVLSVIYVIFLNYYQLPLAMDGLALRIKLDNEVVSIANSCPGRANFELDLNNIQLQGALMKRTTLQTVDLRNALLTNIQGEFLDLRCSNLTDSVLANSEFQDANFSHVDFKRATLENVNFKCANLENARNLTVEQLLETKSLDRVRIDKELANRVRSIRPELFNLVGSSCATEF